MLDLKWIRENPDEVQKGLASKNVKFDLDAFLELDKQRRAALQEVETLKAERNRVNDEIARLKKAGQDSQPAIDSMKSTSQKIKDLDIKVGEIDQKSWDLALRIPNIPDKSVPLSRGAENNKVVRAWGEPKKKESFMRDHLDLAEKLGWFSMEMGVKITGSGFPVYTGQGARLERALINFMIDYHTAKHGYTEMWPPSLVNRASMTGTGQLPKMEEDMYRLKDEDLFLIPTAEVPVTNLFRDETLSEKELPKKLVAYTPCFRREAGSYGKDTRGLSRVHQFDKVEMVKYVKPEEALNELELLVKDAEDILQALELPYRVLLLGSGDLSFAAAKCYDLEVWAPATEKWFEVSSCSTFGDFQARRANIKFKRDRGKKPEFLATLNGSGLALARIVLCLMENFQTPEGTVKLPAILEKYMQGHF